jgi:hypothetical protein
MADDFDIACLRDVIFDLELPRTEFALYGVRCPYCGKSDRIHRLERPEELPDVPDAYQAAWNGISKEKEPVLCMFCRQVLLYCHGDNTVTPPA